MSEALATGSSADVSTTPAQDANTAGKPEWRGGPWPKGYAPNPAGRPPKGHTMADKLRAKLGKASRLKPGSDARTIGDDVIDALVELARSGEPHAVRAIEVILDRTDGKVTVPIEVSNVTMLFDPDNDAP